MVTLDLKRVFVNLVSTGEAVSAPSAIARTRNHDMDGEVRTYAGGRQRFVGQVGEKVQFTFTLRMVTLDTVDTLRSWMGENLQVRDHRGQRFFGVFHNMDVIELRPSTMYDVTMTLRITTTEEAV
jgi:hypothetical protein